MSDDNASDITLLRKVLSKPELYAGERTATAVLAFFSGYTQARCDLGKPLDAWAELFDTVRLNLCKSLSMPPENALAMSQLLKRVSPNDEAHAFELFAAEIEVALRAGNSTLG